MDNVTPDESRGTSRHIEDLISHMETLLESMERDADPKRHFLATYIRTRAPLR